MNVFEIRRRNPYAGANLPKSPLDDLIGVLRVAQQANRSGSSIGTSRSRSRRRHVPLICQRQGHWALAIAFARRVASSARGLVTTMTLEIIVVVSLPVHQT